MPQAEQPSCSARPVAVTGISVVTGLGHTPQQHQTAMETGRTAFRPLHEMPGWQAPELGALDLLPASWISPRSLLAGNRYGPASNLSLLIAREAVRDAGIDAAELHDAWLFCGSSRGNAAGWLAPWPGRRGHRKMATSNTMHSEIATAVSIELDIHGPYQVLTNGCASGLDAIGWAYFAVASGMAPRALVTAVDLLLVPQLLQSFHDTDLCSRNGVNDPYSPTTTGFLPGEAGAALMLEPAAAVRGRPVYGYLHGYQANSDAYDPLGLPPDGAGIADCLRLALEALKARGVALERITAICPHASGTLAHGQAERRALAEVFCSDSRTTPLSLHLMKPFTGHSLGASGAVDMAVLLHFARSGALPPNLPELSGADDRFQLPDACLPLAAADIILKISVGMGGRNAVLTLSREESLV